MKKPRRRASKLYEETQKLNSQFNNCEGDLKLSGNEADNKYNGWTNYETWLLKLNLDNDQGTYNLCQEWFNENYEITETEKPDTYEIADQFKEYLEELFYIEEHSIYKICDTWTHRDWQEIEVT